MASPEYEPKSDTSENPVQHIPETVAIPVHIERKTGIKPVPVQATNLGDDKNVNLVNAVPVDDNQVLTVPYANGQIKSWSSDGINESHTWLAVFWDYVIKKALKVGKNIIRKE